jgi:CheY-like chemotaxis protein
MGDADRLQQVVWNLLSNAVKFTPSGGDVQLTLRQVDNSAEVVVTDTGQGISPDFRPLLFQRFRQEDSTPSRKHGGLGLGLAIVRHLVEAHGGDVQAHSEGRDQGAAFVVRLPLLEVTRRRPAAASAPPLGETLELTGTRVLIVDDEPDARDLVQFVLESRGAKVVAAASASEALDQLLRQSFDVLVADVGMPEQDGYALMRAIRSLPERTRSRVPAVAVTAYATTRERDQAFEAGFDAHAAKPLDPDDLVVLVANAARKPQSP